MIGLFRFVLTVLASPFKSRVGLENAVLRYQLHVLRRRLHGRVRLTNHGRRLYRWVSVDPVGPYDRPARDAPTLAQGRLSLLQALEVAPIGRATAEFSVHTMGSALGADRGVEGDADTHRGDLTASKIEIWFSPIDADNSRARRSFRDLAGHAARSTARCKSAWSLTPHRRTKNHPTLTS
jgi:hypothetical protein